MDIIVDIDGTIADCRHRTHYLDRDGKRDYEKFYAEMPNDKPIWPVIQLVKMLFSEDNQIILCTGRPEEHRKKTYEWLENYNVPFNLLFMRPTGNLEKDYIVKKFLLTHMRAIELRPKLAIEDKQTCVDMWRAEGLITLQMSMEGFPL